MNTHPFSAPLTCSLIDSPLGRLVLAASGEGVHRLFFCDEHDPVVLKQLQREFPACRLVRDDRPGLSLVRNLFDAGSLTAEPPRALPLNGTVFQRRVWTAVARIPRGQTRRYQEIAIAIGSPKSVRAVANAVGANPIALLIPCHRVVRSDGGLGGYRWGVERKHSLLLLEDATLSIA